MKRYKEFFLIFVLFLVGILSRLPFIEKAPSHWDAPNWSIAILRYSFVQETPSPPGYPLYIGLGKAFYFFLHDPHAAIVAVSVLFAGIGAIACYFVGKTIFNKTTGLIASILFLSAPTMYFFGITANPYGGVLTTTSLLACIVFLIWFRKRKYGLLLGLMYSFAVGFRPQEAIFVTPLFIAGVYFLPWRQRAFAAAAFLLTFLVWFFMTVQAVGGLAEYLFYIDIFLKNDAAPNFLLSRFEEIWFILARGYYLSFGIAGVFLLYYVLLLVKLIKEGRVFTLINSKNFVFTAFFFLWIFPSLYFNTFVRSDHAAHQVTYLSGMLFLISYAIWRATQKKGDALFILLVMIVTFNLITFFRDRDPNNNKRYIDQSYHYSELRKNDRRMKAKVQFIRKYFSPNDSVILTTPTMWRVYMYYFREYKILEIDALGTRNSQFVDVRRDSQYWDYTQYYQSNHVFIVPKNIKNLVVLADDEYLKIENTQVKEARLDAGALLYVIPVREGDSFNYGYYRLKKVTNEEPS